MPVVKILSRHSPSYRSLVKYILKEGKAERNSIVTHNLRSRDIDGIVGEYSENESYRQRYRSDQVYITHEIVSFHRDEDSGRITAEMLNDIARKYISLRGEDGVYLGAVHRDTEHVHIHFMSSPLKYRTGISNHVAKPKLHELKVQLERYHKEKYPEISKSFCDHGKGAPYLTDRAWQAANREARNKAKMEVSESIQTCLSEAITQDHFLILLREAGLHHYERNGRIEGVVAPDGMKFRFTRLGVREKVDALAPQKRPSTIAIKKTYMKEREKMELSDKELNQAYWEAHLRHNEQELDAVSSRIDILNLDTENVHDDQLTQEQRQELEELERLHTNLTTEREDLQLSRMSSDQFEEQDHADIDDPVDDEQVQDQDQEIENDVDEFNEIRDENEDDHDLDDDLDVDD